MRIGVSSDRIDVLERESDPLETDGAEDPKTIKENLLDSQTQQANRTHSKDSSVRNMMALKGKLD